MKSLTNVLISSLFILGCSVVLGQYNTKKYIKINSKPEVIVYGDSSIYSRGLLSVGSTLYIGNSDGTMYYMKPQNKKSELLFKMPNFKEIRDIEQSNDTIIGMFSGRDSKLLVMDNQGPVRIVKYHAWKNVFFNSIDIHNNAGFIMGDPVDGRFSLFHSRDGGTSWTRCEGRIKAMKGEVGFAASGTSVQILNDSTYTFISGGSVSRFFKSTNNGKTWSVVVLPYFPGQSSGAFSMCFSDEQNGVIVGGDYRSPELRMNTTFYTSNGGESWMNAMNTTRGYRSCVYHVDGVFYACGRNGIDFSLNGGKDWIPFADGSFYSMKSMNDQLIATSLHGTIYMFDLIKRE